MFIKPSKKWRNPEGDQTIMVPYTYYRLCESYREAVCNSLIHCQWRMLEGVVIERYPDHLYFSNPGTMLITVEEFFEGGHSICRNRILQKMFIVFGRGERLGSGADIISQGWKENN